MNNSEKFNFISSIASEDLSYCILFAMWFFSCHDNESNPEVWTINGMFGTRGTLL